MAGQWRRRSDHCRVCGERGADAGVPWVGTGPGGPGREEAGLCLPAAGLLRHGGGPGLRNELYQAVQAALRRLRHADEYAVHRAGGQLVRRQDRRVGGLRLRPAAIFAGALRAQRVPGVLRLCAGFRGPGSGGPVPEQGERRPAGGVYCGGAGPGLFPFAGRLPVLDGLHAGKLPEGTLRPVSDHL